MALMLGPSSGWGQTPPFTDLTARYEDNATLLCGDQNSDDVSVMTLTNKNSISNKLIALIQIHNSPAFVICEDLMPNTGTFTIACGDGGTSRLSNITDADFKFLPATEGFLTIDLWTSRQVSGSLLHTASGSTSESSQDPAENGIIIVDQDQLVIDQIRSNKVSCATQPGDNGGVYTFLPNKAVCTGSTIETCN